MSGNHRHRGGHDRPGLGKSETVAELGQRRLGRIAHFGREVGGRERAGRRVVRPTDAAVFPDQHRHAPIAAGVARHFRAQSGKNPDHGRGLGVGLGHVEPGGERVRVVAQVDLDFSPLRIGPHRDPDRQTLGRRAGKRIMGALARDLARGQTAERRHHPALAVVEPVPAMLGQHVPADLAAERQQLALPDPRRPDHCQIVAIPLPGHADPRPADPDDVLDVAIVFLNFDRGKDQRAFLVDVAGGREIGGGLRVADVGLMRLGERREAVAACLVDDRHHDGMIGRVRVAVIGRVVEEGIAPAELRMERQHRARHDVGSDQHVRGQALGLGEQLVAGGQDAAGEIARAVDQARARGPEQRVRHLARDRLEPARKHREPDPVPHGSTLTARFLLAPERLSAGN